MIFSTFCSYENQRVRASKAREKSCVSEYVTKFEVDMHEWFYKMIVNVYTFTRGRRCYHSVLFIISKFYSSDLNQIIPSKELVY